MSDPIYADSYTRLKWMQERLAESERVRRQLAEALRAIFEARWAADKDGLRDSARATIAALAASDALEEKA